MRRDLAERRERGLELAPEVDRLRDGLARLRKMGQCGQGLLESRRRLSPGASSRRLGRGLAEEADRFDPQLAAEGVIGEPLHVLGDPVAVQGADGLDDAGMQRAAAPGEEAAVGHIVGALVALERVLEIAEGASLVEELGGLQMPQALAEGILGRSAISRSSANGTSLPTTAADCSRGFSSGDNRSIRGGENGLHRRRHLDARDGPGEPGASGVAGQGAPLDERADALLEEQRVAFGAPDQQVLEGSEARCSPSSASSSAVAPSAGNGSMRAWLS